jgi:hypothetical protein
MTGAKLPYIQFEGDAELYCKVGLDVPQDFRSVYYLG